MAAPDEAVPQSPTSTVTRRGSFTVLGFPATPVEVTGFPRGGRWRGIRAGIFILLGLILAPIVGMIPPHAPWVAAALGLGFFLGIRKWRERFTVATMAGRCPKCGEPLALEKGSAIRPGMAVSCDNCHHDAILTLDGVEDRHLAPNP